ncbi:MAG: hypothetical protein ACFBSC_10550 [Microcoleaceae cyanobacterium]
MKIKSTAIALGILGFSLLAPAIHPTVAQAQANPGARREQIQQELELTNAQRQQIQQIQQSTRERLSAVLTDSQKAQLRSALEQQTGDQGRGSLRQALRNLNLTETQQKQIRAIRQETRQQMQDVLTPEQKEKIEQLRQQR